MTKHPTCEADSALLVPITSLESLHMRTAKAGSANDDGSAPNATTAGKAVFHIILSDRDEWAVEVEWPDSTLERVSIFKNNSSAANWVATESDAWLQFLRIQQISSELRQATNALLPASTSGAPPRRPHDR
jgi:hypothetical protein